MRTLPQQLIHLENMSTFSEYYADGDIREEFYALAKLLGVLLDEVLIALVIRLQPELQDEDLAEHAKSQIHSINKLYYRVY